ncbi:MAG: hypothetical protein ACREJ8_10455 [Candidatus Methylomirabilales bacterium]
MGRHPKTAIWLGIIAVVLAACGTTQEARQEDKLWEDFKLSLAERQVARRRQTAEVCQRRGVTLPGQYQQKGGGILEEYVPSRPPCGIPARERIDGAEGDFRATWQAVMGTPVPVPYEWLLAAKRRIAVWLDAGGLTPAEATTVLREAQWVVSESESRALPAAAESGQPSSTSEQTFARLNTALNQALAEHGIACRHKGGSQPCF